MKRVTTFILALFMAVSCVAIPASASVYASKTICSSSAELYAGKKAGQFDIDYSVLANEPADSLGVKRIKIFKMNGEQVTTIAGTVYNGLAIRDYGFHMGTYTYNNAISGQYYYAEVTVYATIGSDSDTYTHTTATVKAP